MNNISNLPAEGLQQQKSTPGAPPVNQEQETEATIHTGSLKMDNRRLDDVVYSDELFQFCFLGFWAYGRLTVLAKTGSPTQCSSNWGSL